ncbi:MAG: TonB-dependent receptor plug domain-containing protein, partial [Kiritimatiellae bacterium]|nr:TonB-dependent receptor plug domain-containing protein [Kiritimatiellia bacterium]
MDRNVFIFAVAVAAVLAPAYAQSTNDAVVAVLDRVVVVGDALSKYRPEKVEGASFTPVEPEKLPTVVDSITEDFIREHNPTDLHDLLRYVPGIETGGKSLLIRQPGTFSIRGMGGSEPAFDGVVPVGSGAGLFMDPFLMERVEIVKGPIGSLSGGAGAQQNNSGAGGSVNMYLKGANFKGDEIGFQENTSVGKNTWRQRGMVDANEVVAEDRFAFRAIGTFDIYSPAYVNTGSQKGADPRQSYALSPSFVVKPAENVTVGFKSIFQKTDQPSYIGVPVWRGKPAGGYGWYESSCREGDRSKYDSIMLNPYVDWQVTDDWLLKFGGAFMFSDWRQTTREPYMNNAELAGFYRTGEWLSGEKYMTSGFSSSKRINRNYNLYARSVYSNEELPFGFRNSLVFQPDFYYRESTSGFGAPVSRYGAMLQDSLGWGWVTVLGGIRYDYFAENHQSVTSTETVRAGRGRNAVSISRKVRTDYSHCDEFAFSPRGGLTVQPLDWFVVFGNISQTRTPTLGFRDADGSRPTDPWTATQYEGGLRIRPVGKLWLSGSFYRIEQKNTPVAETVNNDTYYFFEGRNRSRGVELSMTGDIT